MSKKLAEGIQGLVLDVKTGKGAFLPGRDDSRELAQTMVALGEARGVRTAALITGMDAPLGRAVGNGLETKEAFNCLAGRGPSDLTDLCDDLVGEMLFLGGKEVDPEAGSRRAGEALRSGVGLERMARLVELQGGDPRVVLEPERLPRAPEVSMLRSEEAGFVGDISPVLLGYGVVGLGGGRRKMNDVLDSRVGFVLEIALGDRVEVGDALGEVHAADLDGLAFGLETLREAINLVPDPPLQGPSLVLERVGAPDQGVRRILKPV
jgi:thymidine phosphorylase